VATLEVEKTNRQEVLGYAIGTTGPRPDAR
jgi:hypothetical protein